MFAIRFLCSLFLGPALLVAAEHPAELPRSLQQMIVAPLPPLKVPNPQLQQMLLLERSATVPLAFLAAPAIGLAGTEIDSKLGASKRRNLLLKPALFDLQSKRHTAVSIPSDRNVSAYNFSPNGHRLALLVDTARGPELWMVDTANGKARLLQDLLVNDIFTEPLVWSHDSQSLYIAARPQGGKKPAVLDPFPTIEEAKGTKVPSRTYAHLLKSPADLSLFQDLAQVQWFELKMSSMQLKKIGEPGLYASLHQAPGGQHLLVKRFQAPFSYAVPATMFSFAIEVWNRSGQLEESVLEMPLAEDVPPEGERKGPRAVAWQPDHPARLLWLEALDEGDPRKKVAHRDRLMSWDFPFQAQPVERRRFQERVATLQYLPAPDQMLIGEFNPDSNLVQINLHKLEAAAAVPQKILAYDVKDAYQHPGRTVTATDAKGVLRLVQEGPWIFLEGEGRNPKGEQPFLDRLNLETGEKQRIFASDGAAPYIEEFVMFLGKSSQHLLLQREAPTSPPNLWRLDLRKNERTPVTEFLDQVPAMTEADKRALVFKRKDGLTLSGTLYLPRGTKTGQKLPAMVWAYPQEYRTAEVAGQVRVADKRYSRPPAIGIQWLVTQGYAVLDNAAMPLIGDKESVNNSFVPQIIANAEAVVEALDQVGMIDRQRIAVGGHSYGAFMTANLLAHTPLFCAGVARSGAYNRSLTPFGFQSERRTFWEAKDFYMNVSPFYHAEKIKTPLLLIHGKDDNNSGTLPMQTERMFHALRGIGGTARMVLLPFESHGYRSRENIFLAQAETLKWLQRWCGGADQPSP